MTQHHATDTAPADVPTPRVRPPDFERLCAVAYDRLVDAAALTTVDSAATALMEMAETFADERDDLDDNDVFLLRALLGPLDDGGGE